MPRKARIREIELLRGLAFLAVALQHAIAHYAGLNEARMGDGVLMAILLLAAKFAVPVFIFITGMVLFYNYDGQLRYGSFLRKRFGDIVVPYILWSAVYFTENPGWSGDLLHRFETFASHLVTGKNSYHLWYIVMIVQFYALFPVLRCLMRACAKRIPFRWRAAGGRHVMPPACLSFVSDIRIYGGGGNSVFDAVFYGICGPQFFVFFLLFHPRGCCRNGSGSLELLACPGKGGVLGRFRLAVRILYVCNGAGFCDPGRCSFFFYRAQSAAAADHGFSRQLDFRILCLVQNMVGIFGADRP